MFRRFSANFALISVVLDFFLIDLALFLASLLRPFFNPLPFIKDIPPALLAPVLYILFPLLWIAILLLFSLYDGRRNLRLVDELASLFLGSSLAGVAMAGILYFSFRDISRFLFLIFLFFGVTFLFGWRLLVRIAWHRKGGYQKRKVLILAPANPNGSGGELLRTQIKNHPEFGLELAGIIYDNPIEIDPYVERVRALIQNPPGASVDDVVLALPLQAETLLSRLVSELHDLPVRVWVIPDYFSLALHRASVEEFAGIPLLDLRAPALSETQRMVKRAFDLILVCLSLPLLLPLMACIALIIILDSGRPVFYLQKRVGENGKLFEMIKFRSMVVEAGLLPIPSQKTPHDPRITRSGRFLRRTSLDELPQIWNILRGEMSLVGPRPELPHLVEKYQTWQRKRFAIPQGLTGWWQVNGRSDRPMHLHTEDDLYYVQHYSIWLDIQILLKTIGVVIRGKGAY